MNHDKECKLIAVKFAQMFGLCPDNPHDTCHTFHHEKGICIHCGARFPYGESEPAR